MYLQLPSGLCMEAVGSQGVKGVFLDQKVLCALHQGIGPDCHGLGVPLQADVLQESWGCSKVQQNCAHSPFLALSAWHFLLMMEAVLLYFCIYT